jgi:hypothetical protein
MASYEAGTTGNDNIAFHLFLSFYWGL